MGGAAGCAGRFRLDAGNRASGNGVGINLDGGQNGFTGNHIFSDNTGGNHAAGLVVANKASYNFVVGNVSNGNQGAPGQGGGIVLVAVTGNMVRDNVANRNLDVGIGVFENRPGEATGNVLTSSTANANRAHGISAVNGTVDGGGNAAHHNTPHPDCLGIACT